MARPTVSVIIPAYRAEATIAQALRGVYAQTCPADEVVVVDDGSPDGTAAVVEREYPSARLLRQANGGPAKARNAGAAAASGDWLAFLDADDRWLPDKLERQLQLADDLDLAVVATRIVGRRDEPFDPAPGFDALWLRNTIGTSTVLVRRSAYLQVGGMSEDMPLCEDYHLWLRLSAAGWRFAICDAPLTVYAPAPDSLTQQRLRFAETERLCIEDIAARFSVAQDRMRRRIAEGYRKHARGAIAFRDMQAARQLLGRSLQYHVTAGQLVDLLVANLPVALLDLRRRFLASTRRAAGENHSPMTTAPAPASIISWDPENSSTPIRVLFCCDPGYFQHMAAALVSLLENNGTHLVEVHLITSRRDPAMEHKLAAIIEKFPGAQLQIHGFEWAKDTRWHTSHHITHDAYLRLFAAEILPASIDRIIYLDADLLVLADLGPLWEVELGDSALAAAPDPFGQGRREALGMPLEALYVNSGVLLLNLARWRSTAALKRLSAYIEQMGDRLVYHDQDAINAVFAGEIRVVDYRWNVPTRLWCLPRDEVPSDPEAVKRAMRSPGILHFTTLRKPWLWVMPTPHKDLYWQYLRRTPWRDARPADRRASKLFERTVNYACYALRLNYTWERILRRTTLGRILVRLHALMRTATP